MYLFSRTKNGDQLNSSKAATNASPDELGRTDRASQATGDARTGDARAQACLEVLGLGPGARWVEITEAHARLVSDLTPGPGASHRNVALAEQFLLEVNDAFDSLQLQSVSAKRRFAG